MTLRASTARWRVYIERRIGWYRKMATAFGGGDGLEVYEGVRDLDNGGVVF